MESEAKGEDKMETLKDRLKALKKAGVSYSLIAKKADISRSLVSKFLAGENGLSPETQEKIEAIVSKFEAIL